VEEIDTSGKTAQRGSEMTICKLTEAQSDLLAVSDRMKVGDWYRYYTRHEDKEVREEFQAEKNIEGTHAWAIRIAFTVVRGHPSYRPCDQDCEKAKKILSTVGSYRG